MKKQKTIKFILIIILAICFCLDVARRINKNIQINCQEQKEDCKSIPYNPLNGKTK